MSEKKTQAVFFDLDGTLTGFSDEVYDEVLRQVCGELAGPYGIDAAELATLHRKMSVAHWRNVAAGVFTAKNGSRDGEQIMLDIWVDALEAAGCNDEAAARIGHDAYWAARKGIFTLYDDALPALEQLHGLLPLVVITNGPADLQEDKLRILGIDRYFDLIVGRSWCREAGPGDLPDPPRPPAGRTGGRLARRRQPLCRHRRRQERRAQGGMDQPHRPCPHTRGAKARRRDDVAAGAIGVPGALARDR
jgi:beta-phosphoglucomutase-like phosphatase (HAD superfamily)